METRDLVIVGAGFAGLATAFHLSRRERLRTTVLEQREVPGAHASGRNAGLLLQSEAEPAVRAMLVASGLAYHERPEQVGFGATGSVLLGGRDSLRALRDPASIPSFWRDPSATRQRLPLLQGHRFEAALETPSDGVMDVGRLLEHYRSGAVAAGVELRLDCPVTAVRKVGAVFRLDTPRGPLEAATLVDAAGAWAPSVGTMAGAAPLPLVPFKRHLFILEGPTLPPGSPFVWDIENHFYLRNESGALLVSICDEEPGAAGAETVTPGIQERLAERLDALLPSLTAARLRTVWACQRTKAPDGLFVIGPDPGVEGLFWVAGLGGNGMGASWEVGRLAAEALAGNKVVARGVFDPGRFRGR